MATLPSATITVDAAATAQASGTELISVWAPVKTSADSTPRLFGSAKAIYAQHDYSEGVEYAALHVDRTRKPILFVGLPIATAGAVSREDTSGNTGTCVTTLAAGGSGVMGEHDGVLTVVTGGTIGTDNIVIELSLDGGRSTQRVRLGTASSYAIPYVDVTVSFAAGTLVAGDTIHTWHGSAPKSDSTGWAAARAALALQQRQVRSVLVCGDVSSASDATAFANQLNTYETTNYRFTFGRMSVRDRLPLAAMSANVKRMTGSPSLTFADANPDTITRSAGSFVSDGFVAGDIVTVAGSSNNDDTYVVQTVAALVLTLAAAETLTAEGPVASCALSGYAQLDFEDDDDKITRSAGSWTTDGFRVGDEVTVAGSASNDGTYTVTAVSATELTLETGDLADETASMGDVTVTAGETKAAWMAALTSMFTSVDAKSRVDLGAGRGRVQSPFSLWFFRRPASWAASLREYQHDVHVTTWRKSDGPTGFDLFDTDGNLVEWDDFADGGAGSAARFTTLRSWPNGPQGAFVARSLTRAADASVLVDTHVRTVVNVAQQVAQEAVENATIGQTPLLNEDGTATSSELSRIEGEIDDALEQSLLTNLRGEGPRASFAKFTAATDDDLSVVDAALNGTITLVTRGTIVTVNVVLKVN